MPSRLHLECRDLTTAVLQTESIGAGRAQLPTVEPYVQNVRAAAAAMQHQLRVRSTPTKARTFSNLWRKETGAETGIVGDTKIKGTTGCEVKCKIQEQCGNRDKQYQQGNRTYV